MRFKPLGGHVAQLVMTLVVTLVAFLSEAGAQEKPKARFEYKVVVSAVDTMTLTQSITTPDGKVKIVEHGPTKSAEQITAQFNTLAADGWEYVGPITQVLPSSDRSPVSNTVLSLFKRQK